MIGGFQPGAFQLNFQQEAEVEVRRSRRHPRLNVIKEASVAVTSLRARATLSHVVVSTGALATGGGLNSDLVDEPLPPLNFPEAIELPPYQYVNIHPRSLRLKAYLSCVTVAAGICIAAPRFVRISAASIAKPFKPSFIELSNTVISAGAITKRLKPIYAKSSLAYVNVRAAKNPSDDELLAVVYALRAARKKRLTKNLFMR